jgi:hypothetical protein
LLRLPKTSKNPLFRQLSQDKAMKCYRTALGLAGCDSRTLSNYSLLLYVVATRNIEILTLHRQQELGVLEVKSR